MEAKMCKVSDSILTAAYCSDGKYGSASNMHVTQTAIHLPRSVVSLIRDIANQDHRQISLTHERLSRIDANTINEILELVDC